MHHIVLSIGAVVRRAPTVGVELLYLIIKENYASTQFDVSF